MRFHGLDLNLLVAFVVLMETRSVSRTAERLRLSQPAASGALARLREFFDDQLLVVHGKRLYPTSLAEAMLPHARAALGEVDTMVASSRGFEAATSRRLFRVVASDYVISAVLAPMVRMLAHEAPTVAIDLSLPSERSVDELGAGNVDLLVTLEPYVSSAMPSAFLFEDEYVVVGRRGHPALVAGLDVAGYSAVEHVVVGIGEERVPSFGDRYVERLGIERRVAVIAPTFMTVPWLIEGTDRLTLMHRRLAIALQANFSLAFVDPPFAIPPVREVAQFHRSRAADPGIKWLLDRIAASVDDNRPATPGSGRRK